MITIVQQVLDDIRDHARSEAPRECCGLLVGDPDSGIAPGTAFEQLPDDWSCPECGASRADFDAVSASCSRNRVRMVRKSWLTPVSIGAAWVCEEQSAICARSIFARFFRRAATSSVTVPGTARLSTVKRRDAPWRSVPSASAKNPSATKPNDARPSSSYTCGITRTAMSSSTVAMRKRRLAPYIGGYPVRQMRIACQVVDQIRHSSR